MTRPGPVCIAASEDEPIVWIERTCSRLEAIRAGADELCTSARTCWAVKQNMRPATVEDDCPAWPHGEDEDGERPQNCRCFQIEDGWLYPCSADAGGAVPVWRVYERPRQIRWRLRRLSGRILYRRRSFDGRKSVLWGGLVQRKVTRLDRWLGAPGFYLLGDRWVRPEPLEWIYCAECGCATPRHVDDGTTRYNRRRCLASGHESRLYRQAFADELSPDRSVA